MRFIAKIFAVLFPWLILIICDNPGGALIALVMQLTLIGWPFAAAWAIRSLNEKYFNLESEDVDTDE